MSIFITGRFGNGSKRDLKQYVKFSTVVRRVEYKKDTDDFTTLNMSDVPGNETFRVRVLHSKQIKHLNDFKRSESLSRRIVCISRSLTVMLMKR